jgi:type II secretory pathway component GspD/PulD (secretin)
VWISETNESGLRRLGTNLVYQRFTPADFAAQPWVEENGALREASSRMFTPATDFGSATLPTPLAAPTGAIVTPQLRTGTAPYGFGLAGNIIATDSGTLEGAFRGIENKADLDLISKPEVLVVNGTLATIKAGTLVPFMTSSKVVASLVMEWRDVGVNMQLAPTIMPNDCVQLQLSQLEVSENTTTKVKNLDLPVFSKRSQTGFVLVPSGQTLVIGGLSSRNISRDERRVPILGKVPLLGMAFRKRKSEAQVRTLLVFVSPTIVDLRNLSNDASSALEFWHDKGHDWKHKEDIEKEVKTMSEGL